jgi:DHA2 family multidrug resistance protein
MAKLEAAGLSAAAAQAKLALFVKQQAAVLALNDAFLLTSALCLILSVFVWLAHSTLGPAQTAAQETQEWALEELMEQP